MNELTFARIQKLCWIIITVSFLMALVFSAYTVSNYREIAEAKALMTISVTQTAIPTYDSGGDMTSLALRVDLTVHNPSGKSLRIGVVGYKAWLRDASLESGTDTSRRLVDGDLVIDNSTQWYYPVFSTSFSFDSTETTVPSRSNYTLSRTLLLLPETNQEIMDNVMQIYGHLNDTAQEPEWFGYVNVRLFIEGGPDYTEGGYTNFLIIRHEGIDLTPGSTGVGA